MSFMFSRTLRPQARGSSPLALSFIRSIAFGDVLRALHRRIDGERDTEL
jgi:hypothetical protein